MKVIRTEQRCRQLRDATASRSPPPRSSAGFGPGASRLIADAAHMATDAGGLGLALFAIHIAQKPATRRKPTAICAPRYLRPLSMRWCSFC